MNFLSQFPPISPIAFYILFLWALFWKGLALWRASKSDQRNWFIVMLVLNTVGILEIIFLFRFAKKKFTLGELRTLLRLG